MKFIGAYITLVLGQVASLTQGKKKPHHIKKEKPHKEQQKNVVRKNPNIKGHPIIYSGVARVYGRVWLSPHQSSQDY